MLWLSMEEVSSDDYKKWNLYYRRWVVILCLKLNYLIEYNVRFRMAELTNVF